LCAGDGTKETGLGLAFRETISVEGEAGSTKQSEQEANNGGEHARAFFPTRTGIERDLRVLPEGFCRHDRATSALSPGGNGGTRDVNVLGNGQGAATNDMLTNPMVVGAPCVAYP
jgi:hypothetical protein